MNGNDYKEILNEVADLENELYSIYDLLWKNFWQEKSKKQALTERELDVMDMFSRTMRMFSYVKDTLQDAVNDSSAKDALRDLVNKKVH